MNRDQLNPVAEMLIESYFDTAQYSRDFRSRHTTTPNTMAKAQHLRSVVSDLLIRDDAYELYPAYNEFGRVHFRDLSTDREYLLRSKGAITIERNLRQREAMFDSAEYFTTRTTMLVCEFEPWALALSVAGARRRANRQRLEPTGKPVFIDRWPYGSSPPPAGGVFDQGIDPTGDPFGEIGDLDIDGDEGKSA